MKVAIIFERFGEYHHARLHAVAKLIDTVGIEIAQADDTYEWGHARSRGSYKFECLAKDMSVGRNAIADRLFDRLDKHSPDIVAVPGWFPSYAHAGIDWAYRNNARALIMSDSNLFDAPRRWVVERIKKAIVRHACGGFVAGRCAREYICKLGLPSDRVVLGYNCVDNAHFARDEHTKIRGSGVFLSVGRFIPRKNFLGLLKAFRIYLDRLPAGRSPWRLVLVGDGGQRDELIAEAQRLDLAELVEFPGFAQYIELPGIYHAANVFILPSLVEQWGLVVNEALAAGLPILVSERCGSARDLVLNGFNGYEFDPSDHVELARYMEALSGDPELIQRMASVCPSISAIWDADRFANSVLAISHIMMAEPLPVLSLLDRSIFRAIRISSKAIEKLPFSYISRSRV